MVDLFKFTRKLTLKRFFSTKSNVSNTLLPIYDANTVVPFPLAFQDQCNQQDLSDLFMENNTLDDPVDFLGSINSGLKKKSVFYPSHMRGQYIDIFQKGIERDLSLLAKGKQIRVALQWCSIEITTYRRPNGSWGIQKRTIPSTGTLLLCSLESSRTSWTKTKPSA
ncbi:uncharacterized protein LOC142493392 isoform X2 [Ascaphus truei]|uniref:uncharacterized protein LOC142477677 isoform X3 n=1 Tax=Ascaphus truei TaxID=8439 RepID=UPI003F5951FE